MLEKPWFLVPRRGLKIPVLHVLRHAVDSAVAYLAQPVVVLRQAAAKAARRIPIGCANDRRAASCRIELSV